MKRIFQERDRMMLYDFAIYRGKDKFEYAHGCIYGVYMKGSVLWVNSSNGTSARQSIHDPDFIYLFNTTYDNASEFSKILRRKEEEPATPDEIRQEIKDSMEEGDYLGAVALQHKLDALMDIE